MEVQIFASTHSPLVLASMEPAFDKDKDALWKLDLVEGVVKLERDIWRKRGDANMWLLSDVFDETSPYSQEAEAAMAQAGALMARMECTQAEADLMRQQLRRVLADTDSFWLSWRAWMRSCGWTP